MQTGSNLERSPPSPHTHTHVTVQKHMVTRAPGILLQYAVYDCNQDVPLRMSLPALLHANLGKCRSILH